MTLLSAFETAPSRALYDDLVDMSRGRLRPQLLELLNMLTATSSDTFAVALDVYTSEHQLEPVLDMLNDHSHLLRPRDYSTLQSATVFISRHGHTQRALEILEAELLDTARATRHALLQSFSQMETPANRAEITQIVRTRSGMPGRRARVEAWVDAASTPGADQPNPMMFAAMVMGIGPMPGLSSDDDPYTYLDLDPDDPDLEDLRAEYRPDLKKRFESWADQGVANLENGAASLLSVYRKIIDMLPFLRAPDVAEEMISRYASSCCNVRPSVTNRGAGFRIGQASNSSAMDSMHSSHLSKSSDENGDTNRRDNLKKRMPPPHVALARVVPVRTLLRHLRGPYHRLFLIQSPLFLKRAHLARVRPSTRFRAKTALVLLPLSECPHTRPRQLQRSHNRLSLNLLQRPLALRTTTQKVRRFPLAWRWALTRFWEVQCCPRTQFTL